MVCPLAKLPDRRPSWSRLTCRSKRYISNTSTDENTSGVTKELLPGALEMERKSLTKKVIGRMSVELVPFDYHLGRLIPCCFVKGNHSLLYIGAGGR